MAVVFFAARTVHTKELVNGVNSAVKYFPHELFVDEDGAFLHFGCLCFTAFVAQVASHLADFVLIDILLF